MRFTKAPIPMHSMSRQVWAHLIANGVWPAPGRVEPFSLRASHSTTDTEKALTLFEDGVQLALRGSR